MSTPSSSDRAARAESHARHIMAHVNGGPPMTELELLRIGACLIDCAASLREDTGREREPRANRFDCPWCHTIGTAVDEDGCCRNCGGDAEPYPSPDSGQREPPETNYMSSWCPCEWRRPLGYDGPWIVLPDPRCDIHSPQTPERKDGDPPDTDADQLPEGASLRTGAATAPAPSIGDEGGQREPRDKPPADEHWSFAEATAGDERQLRDDIHDIVYAVVEPGSDLDAVESQGEIDAAVDAIMHRLARRPYTEDGERERLIEEARALDRAYSERWGCWVKTEEERVRSVLLGMAAILARSTPVQPAGE